MSKKQQAIGSGNLWAVGYDDMDRAGQVRDEITRLGWDKHYLILSDVAVVVRHPDGSFTLDREPFPAVVNVVGCALVGFVAGLVVAAPLGGAAVGALLGGAGTALAARVGIGDDFVREVERMMKPAARERQNERRPLTVRTSGPRLRPGSANGAVESADLSLRATRWPIRATRRGARWQARAGVKSYRAHRHANACRSRGANCGTMSAAVERPFERLPLAVRHARAPVRLRA